MIWLSSFFSSTTVLPLLEALSFCWMGKCSIEHIQECSDTCSIQFPRWLGFWTDGANEWWEVSCSEVYSVDPIAFRRWRNWFGRVEGLILLTSRLPEVQSWNGGWDWRQKEQQGVLCCGPDSRAIGKRNERPIEPPPGLCLWEYSS